MYAFTYCHHQHQAQPQPKRHLNKRRRDAVVSPTDLAAAFPAPDARLAPLARHSVEEAEDGAGATPASKEAPRLSDEGADVEEGGNKRRESTTDVTAREGKERGETEKSTKEEQEQEQEQDGLELSSSLARDHVDGNTAGAAALGDEEAAAAAAKAATTTVTPLPPLEASVMHPKLEGTASREKRQKREERLAKLPPPDDPPPDVDLDKRRGGLGQEGEASYGSRSGEESCDLASNRSGVSVQGDSYFFRAH